MNTEKELTGYPSIDKPWLKYYSEEALNTPLPKCTIYEYLWNNNKENLNDIALIYFGQKITYRQLFTNIDMAAEAFYCAGIRPGDVVVICTLNTPEMIYCTYGLNKIGAIADFEYPTLTEDELVEALVATNAKMMILLDLFTKRFSTIQKRYNNIVYTSPSISFSKWLKVLYKYKEKTVIDTYSLLIKQIKSNIMIKNNMNSSEPAIIVHTGGTTGVPKGVVLSNDNINSIALQYKISGMEYKRQDKILHCIPPFHAYGFSVGVHMPLSLGMTICMSIKIDDETMVNLFSKIKPNHFVGSGSHVSAIINSKKIDKMILSFLKTIAIGGAAVNEIIENDVNLFLKCHHADSNLIVGYGLTETSATVCTNMDKHNKIGSVGIPLPKVNIKIIDVDTKDELKYDKVGELYISSPSVMMCYYHNSKETEDILTKENEIIWLRSGDLACVDKDGFVYIKGRIKRIYTVKDIDTGYVFKLYPNYIENTILKSKYVNSCAVVCTKDKNTINIAIAFVVLNGICNDNAIVKEDIYSKFKDLPAYTCPSQILFVDKLPFTPIGKVDYKALEKMAEGMENGNE